ncbi:MAG: hypothetical protein ACI4U9_02840 [Clostridia bacterium]
MESHRIKNDEVGYNRFTMTPNRWKKEFNGIKKIEALDDSKNLLAN